MGGHASSDPRPSKWAGIAGKTVIITGGSGGIGAACARTLAGEGAHVVIADLDEAAGGTIADEICGSFQPLDVTDRDQWQDVVGQVLDARGSIDALIQCAGIEGDRSCGALEMPPELWRQVIDVNLTGTFFGCQAVMPAMLENGQGSIILLSSVVSYMATHTGMPYGASKAAVQHLAKSFAVLGAKDGKGVRVNSVHPGSIKTRMTDDIIADIARARSIPEAEAEAMIVGAIPFGRRGEPADIANIVLYLVSDDAGYVTGSEFKIDGGWLLKDPAA